MNILEQASELVGGDRGANYGHPFDDFGRTGRIWAAVLGVDEVTPEQVALCMMAVKMSRLCNTPSHRDSVVDIAGYARTYEMVRQRRQCVDVTKPIITEQEECASGDGEDEQQRSETER